MASDAPLTAIIVEDHEMVSEMMAARLGEAGFDVVATATTADAGERAYKMHRPDLVLCDVELEGGSSGIDLVGRLLAVDSEARVVMVSAENEPHIVQEAYSAGAVGYVAKRATSHELLSAVAEAMQGVTGVADRYTYRRLIEALQAPEPPRVALTPRERELVDLMVQGVTTTRALAEAMFIQPNSVRSHVDGAMRKLEARTRAEIVAKAYQRGLVRPPK